MSTSGVALDLELGVEKQTLAAASTAFCRENLAKYSAVAASVNPINT
ncbi:hypothetical protein [Ligilactobacillus ruminis]|nr:hypothetical protein [Ligilactobacillus ruminis]